MSVRLTPLPNKRPSRPSRPAPGADFGAARIGPLVVYGALSALAIGIAIVREQNPVTTDPWLPLPEVVDHVVSIAVGLALASATIGLTRHGVRRWSWARTLHADLRPAVRGAGGVMLVVLGVASAASEELFFRGVLATTVGVVVSSLAFGLLHQVRGKARWVWASWAAVMGLAFATLFLATGSLLGPIVAHATINVVNLRFLRDTDVEPPKQRRLGGLLGNA